MEDCKNKEIDFRANKLKYLNRLNSLVRKRIDKKNDNCFYITELDRNFKNSELWLDASLFIYHCLLFLFEDTGLDFSLLHIPLSCSEQPAISADLEKINFIYLQEAVSTYDPPFVMLRPLGTDHQCIFLENLSKELQKRVYYAEEQTENNVYLRCIIVCKQ